MNEYTNPIQGVARRVELSIRYWRSKVDLTIVDTDDYPMLLGIEFLDKSKALVMPSLNSICIMSGDNACTVPVAREANRKTRRTTEMRIANKPREEQPTRIVAKGKLEEGGEVPKADSYKKTRQGGRQNKLRRMLWIDIPTSSR